MKSLRLVPLVLASLLFGACAPMQTGTYSVTAFAPKNPGAVRVKVSTSTQHIYVMEGDRLLMAVQGCVGEGHSPTPSGNFTIGEKIKTKRSGSYGFYVNGNSIVSAKAGSGSGRYVGYPMAYWCGLAQAPSYGFHQGFVHPHPRTHGCIRLHKEAAARLFALVHPGTPVNIASSQPEDSTIGHFVRKLDESRAPDPNSALLISDRYFADPAGPLLKQQ
jgi:hypothetical protein